ncbi:aldehyde dehydrogenase family protein [Pseudoroseicyclus tamaricis]|uniref:Aldehyde dehydrogenase family protein n=1 Tax=Pseudoroseicyclus tamaricis TaxID=2705421 RepID=A0A6B2JFZ1_9RHOB|nr:aldehyde dehydrogenase family protein [Pseudoroseicyclus tamaricis]NDV00041.1 aldehyde dehydrogenase family protein [Pseudoroseicyclus tamaricis]
MTDLPAADSGADPSDLAAAWLARLEGVNLIDGAVVPAAETLEVLEPAQMRALGRTAASGAAEVEAAVAAAKAAGEAWAETPARDRGRAVQAAARALMAEAEPLARLLARETGKAIRTECRGELAVAADLLEMFGGLGSELKGETLPFRPDTFAVTTREPLGVIAAILPWNVPLVLMMLKIAPALVAGNTVVVKAAEVAPFATLAAAEILNAHLPPGVLNVVVGTGPDCGQPLCDHPDVAKITFTGSEKVGETIHAAAARRLIPVSLELGGKSPMIVCDDVDLDRAIDGAVTGMRFTRAGQSCTAASRLYVHRSVYEPFVAGLRARLDALVIGDPLDEATDVGTIVSPAQKATVERYLSLADAAPEAEVIRCGALPGTGVAPDLFLQPTLILHIDAASPVVREEIFGPVTVIQPWDDWDAVLEQANDTTYGLAASIWTRDLSRALKGTKALNAGFVQVNAGFTIQPNLSYGGFGRSGLGKEASLESMLEHFTRKKTVIMAMD